MADQADKFSVCDVVQSDAAETQFDDVMYRTWLSAVEVLAPARVWSLPMSCGHWVWKRTWHIPVSGELAFHAKLVLQGLLYVLGGKVLRFPKPDYNCSRCSLSASIQLHCLLPYPHSAFVANGC